MFYWFFMKKLFLFFLISVVFVLLISFFERLAVNSEVEQSRIIYNKELKCHMYYDQYVLYITSITKPRVDRKDSFCYVEDGAWLAQDDLGETMVYFPSDLVISHKLSFTNFKTVNDYDSIDNLEFFVARDDIVKRLKQKKLLLSMKR